MTRSRVSIVVPTRGRRDSVMRLLGALSTQTVPPDLFDVVVAIDGPDPATAAAVDGHGSEFRVRQVSQPQRGRAAACNAGAGAALGSLVIFLDDDMEPAPGFVAAHLNAHASEEGPGTVLGVVGAAPIVVPPDAPPVVVYRATHFSRKLVRLADRRDDLPFNDIYTGNFSISRDVFTSVGGYDESFDMYGHEDYELALRLKNAGVRFRFDTAALAQQHYAKAFRSLAANVEEEGRTAVRFALKHPEVLSTLPLSRYARLQRRERVRVATLASLSRVSPRFNAHLIESTELYEQQRSVRFEQSDLFARYDAVFELLYWAGAERELHYCGVPAHAIAIRNVKHWIDIMSRPRVQGVGDDTQGGTRPA